MQFLSYLQLAGVLDLVELEEGVVGDVQMSRNCEWVVSFDDRINLAGIGYDGRLDHRLGVLGSLFQRLVVGLGGHSGHFVRLSGGGWLRVCCYGGGRGGRRRER
ncbi:MAG TPA: hypothetical protein VFV83_01945, partial [Chthoniobacteraceae bacterium]|nr:hypothetical protein [Chthoniobacteraceae bacterium]